MTEKHLSLDKSPNYADFQLTIQYQKGLDIIGVGAAGQVYNVDDYVVLKACRIYKPPSSDAAPRALWDYGSETIFHVGIFEDEKPVLRLLTEHPHPNIIEAIYIDHPERIYLRKYQPLSALTPGSQSDRIFGTRTSYGRLFTSTNLVSPIRTYAKIIYSLINKATLYLVILAPVVHLDTPIHLFQFFSMDRQRLSLMQQIDLLWVH
ncbi:hypothetical protein MY8738_008243 [Beauveria namnaoensis]